LNTQIFGQYCAGDSLLHHLDPRTKIICMLLFLAATFAVGSVLWIAAFFLIVVLLFILGGISLQIFWRNIRLFIWLYAVTFIIHLFIHPGDMLFRVPLTGWTATQQGVQFGVLFTVRIAVLLSLSTLLMLVTTPQDITDGLERLLKPLSKLKVPVGEIALMISIALRFVPTLMEEAARIQKAQAARGADLEGSGLKRLRKSIPMILPLFSGALKKADNLALALEARGYRGGRNRTKLIELKYRNCDLFSLVSVLIFTISVYILS